MALDRVDERALARRLRPDLATALGRDERLGKRAPRPVAARERLARGERDVVGRDVRARRRPHRTCDRGSRARCRRRRASPLTRTRSPSSRTTTGTSASSARQIAIEVTAKPQRIAQGRRARSHARFAVRPLQPINAGGGAGVASTRPGGSGRNATGGASASETTIAASIGAPPMQRPGKRPPRRSAEDRRGRRRRRCGTRPRGRRRLQASARPAAAPPPDGRCTRPSGTRAAAGRAGGAASGPAPVRSLPPRTARTDR